jgi:iron complex outermembrane recepter protein
MSFASARGMWLASAALSLVPSSPSFSQPASSLPPVLVSPQQTPQRAVQRSKRGGAVRTVQPATPAPSAQPAPPVPGSLTVLTAQQALREIQFNSLN